MATRGVNKVILLGNLGRDPEMRTFGNGEHMASFSIATSETWKDSNTGEMRERTEWHRCVAYRRLAEVIGQYARKGSKLYVEGRLQTRQWQDQQSGQTRYSTEVVVDNMQFVDSRSGGSAPATGAPQNYGQQNYAMNNPPSSAPQKPVHPQANMPQGNAAPVAYPPPVAPQPMDFGADPDAGFGDDDIPF